MPSLSRAATIGAPITVNGYTFTNFDPTVPGVIAGSNVNGISNTGQTVGFAITPNGNFINFAGTPANTTLLNTGPTTMAFGINSAGDVV
jgi:hypothetical protein